MKTPPKRTTGMVLGKFMPPHLGHLYLIQFANHYVDDLTVVVGTLKSEPIPGDIRYHWMQELIPHAQVLHLTDENPQDPSEHPDFWQIWQESLRRILRDKPDFVFASESYGKKLAEVLGSTFVSVDTARTIVPVSGTAIREDPLGNWAYVPECVRPYFAKRVCIFGPESTGKSTLAKNLAQALNTVWVPEYARTVIEDNSGKITPKDIPRIALGQTASEDALVRFSNKVLICDTDLLSTVVWSEVLFGECPPWIREKANHRHYDLYLLCDVDVPWVDDVARYRPDDRKSFYQRCKQELESRGRRYVAIRGSWEERFETAMSAIATLLDAG